MLIKSLDLSVYRNVCFHIFQYPLDIELHVKSPAAPSGAVRRPFQIRDIRSLDVALFIVFNFSAIVVNMVENQDIQYKYDDSIAVDNKITSLTHYFMRNFKL